MWEVNRAGLGVRFGSQPLLFHLILNSFLNHWDALVMFLIPLLLPQWTSIVCHVPWCIFTRVVLCRCASLGLTWIYLCVFWVTENWQKPHGSLHFGNAVFLFTLEELAAVGMFIRTFRALRKCKQLKTKWHWSYLHNLAVKDRGR